MTEIDFSKFKKIDMRVGTVISATVPEWSHWVMKLTVDFGKEVGTRSIFSGIMKFYKPKDLEGKQFPFVINLKPKKIGPEGDFSQGMMLMSEGELDITTDDEETKPILFHLPEKVPNGAVVR